MNFHNSFLEGVDSEMEMVWVDVNFVYRQQLRMSEPESGVCKWESIFRLKKKKIKNQEATLLGFVIVNKELDSHLTNSRTNFILFL